MFNLKYENKREKNRRLAVMEKYKSSPSLLSVDFFFSFILIHEVEHYIPVANSHVLLDKVFYHQEAGCTLRLRTMPGEHISRLSLEGNFGFISENEQTYFRASV